MKEWKEYKIGDIAKTNTSQYSLSENWDRILYLDTGSITKNQISNVEKFFGNDALPSRARRKVKHGDIVYSCVRPNLCHYGYLDNPPANLLVSTGFVVITVNPQLADSRYIFYYLTQSNIVQSLHSIAEQAVSTYPSIKASDIEDLSICLPSLPNQRKIASILKSLDDKIEINRRINDNLEQQAQALFKSWFVDFEPFKDGEFVESELGMIPKGWRVGTLDEVCSLISRGLTPKYNDTTDEFILGQTCVRDNIVTLNNARKHMPKSKTEKWVKQWDIMINSTGVGSLGRVGIVYFDKNNVTIDSHLTVVRVKDPVMRHYVGRNILNRQEEIENMAIGSTGQTELPRESVKSMPILIPTEEIMRMFNSIIEPMALSMFNNINNNSLLSNTRDTLLPRLMLGELKVSDVETII
ncbi:MAG: restriction endonuclease subunit S [Bacteroidaceae bacterium]|nr:restriction endonuclease subunit S [Bacteroidaceae bacterium]